VIIIFESYEFFNLLKTRSYQCGSQPIFFIDSFIVWHRAKVWHLWQQ
jgi:hypothetical protein